MTNAKDLGPANLPAALLREVDHRVKNNLQLIASLILLQGRSAPDDSARVALKSVLERVTAIATVHRRLFQEDPLTFDVAEFLRDLTGDLAAAAGRDDLQIVLHLDAVFIPASSAAALALVVNELLGNALKHAFPPGRPGRIAVNLTEHDGALLLTIADDGVGLAGGESGFGSTLIKLLCQQLHAKLAVEDAGPGVKATLSVPIGQGSKS